MPHTLVAEGLVIAVDAANSRLTVIFRDGAVLSGEIGVNMIYQGYADALRVRQAPLPQIGTWGLVIFPNGNWMNGFWLGAIYVQQQNALIGDQNDPTLDYHSHWSGVMTLTNASGVTCRQWPDSSFEVAGAGAVPTVYRHIVDGNQQQQQVVSSFSDRVANKANPFEFLFSHAAGTTRTYDTSGGLTVNGGSGAAWKMVFGGTSLDVDTSGNWTVNGAAGAVCQFNFNGGTLEVGTDGSVTVTVPTGKQVHFTGNGASDQLALVSLLVAAFNSHVHPGDSGGTTGPPKTPWTASTIASNYFTIS